MINKKLTGLLLISAIAAGIGMANAATSATQTLTGTLSSFIDITADGGNVAANIDTTTGNLSVAMTPKFKVQTNSGQSVYLHSTVKDSTNANVQSLFQQGATVYIMLGNTATVAQQPTTAAITNCSSGSPVAANNSNVIAYSISSLGLNNSATSSFNNTKKQYAIVVVPGTTNITLTTGTAPYTNTYSFGDDTSGNYQSIVTVTTTSL